jgi:selenocysteine-specific elongation factor
VAVLALLGVRTGVVAVTRSDLADPSSATEEVRPLVPPGTPVVPVAAPLGRGLDALRTALDSLLCGLRPAPRPSPPRLFVDRSFSVPGAGTVAIGTLWGDALRVGDPVRVLPGGATARIRSIEVHGAPVDRAAPGRAALALAGASRSEVPRGACVVRASDTWAATPVVEGLLDLLPQTPPLRAGSRLQTFLGTSEVTASVLPLDGEVVHRGAAVPVRLRLTGALPAAPGDRLVLRGPAGTLGAVTVLDTAPAPGRRAWRAARVRVLGRGDPREVAALRLEEAGPRGLDAAEAGPGGVLLGGRRFAPAVVETARRALVAGDPSGLPAPAAGELTERLIVEGALRRSTADPPGTGELAAVLRRAGRTPPSESQLRRLTGLHPDSLAAATRTLLASGRAVRAGRLVMDARVADEAVRVGVEALRERPRTLGELRDLWGVGRRHAEALALLLDARGLSVRRGDRRHPRRQ